MDIDLITNLLILSGISHIIMSILSASVPSLLGWKPHLDATPPLLCQIFWTYSAYIKMICIAFGIVSIVGARELTGHAVLATSINSFIVFFWVARLEVEFFYYDRSTLTGIAKLADRTLNVLIVFFIVVHGIALAQNVHLFQ